MRYKNYSFPFLILVVFILTTVSCKQLGLWNNASGTSGSTDDFSSSPVLSASESMKKMKLEEGFNIRLVAEEPLLNTPVALTFDEKGRIWVVEMESYMPDTLGTGEDQPSGKIVILTDKNGDGQMDDRKIFLDSLVLPRAICLIGKGILVAESPRLWYYEIENDRPVRKTLVDAAYAEGGNVEHQPNGLFRALDNWIYNAKSGKRYRQNGDSWLIERTHFRGQWGISQDDQGRLYYNTNSQNLEGDFFSPGLGAGNDHQRNVSGFGEDIIKDNKVYPIRPNTGVNRAYLEGTLDANKRLVNFTAACGPVIYQGDLFGSEYKGNAFVAEPSANLIKRNILTDTGYITGGRQAYKGREFLASKDERFRPVNLFNGPDGALYIIDMYRGIIQHKTYLTPYLKNQIKERNLTQPLSYGRIYKVVPWGKKAKSVKFSKDPLRHLSLLQHPNGWIRSKAQQLLVDSRDKELNIPLRKLLNTSEQTNTIVHALWTMEGLGVLLKEDVLPLLKNKDWRLRMQGLSVSPSVIKADNYKEFTYIFKEMLSQNDTLAAPYIAFLAPSIQVFDKVAAKDLLLSLSKEYPNNIFVSDAIISNLKDREADYYREILSFNPDSNLAINRRLKKITNDLSKKKTDNLKTARDFPKGAAIFQSFCQTCHGADGNGINNLAPPLNNSNWVLENKDRLIKVVLFGLNGPVKVGNKIYKAPEINGEMPGIAANPDFSDEDIAQLLSYVRNSWSNKAVKVNAEEVQKIRKEYKGRVKPFTEGDF